MSLWADTGIQNTWKLRCYFSVGQIPENAAYFFNKCTHILSVGYVHPTQQMNFHAFFADYLRINTPFTNTRSVNATIGQYTFKLEESPDNISKNMPEYELNNTILYVIPISDYDINVMNGLQQSINLFHHLLVLGTFNNKSIYLIFNNYGEFAEKIKHKPITNTFDDFPQHKMNPNDKNCVFTFIVEKFLRILACGDVVLNGSVNILRINALNSQEVDSMFNSIAVELLKKQRQKKKS
eukprot:715910_1